MNTNPNSSLPASTFKDCTNLQLLRFPGDASVTGRNDPMKMALAAIDALIALQPSDDDKVRLIAAIVNPTSHRDTPDDTPDGNAATAPCDTPKAKENEKAAIVQSAQGDTPKDNKDEEKPEKPETVTVCGATVRVDATELDLWGRGIMELSAADVAAIARLTRLERVHLGPNQLSTVPADLFAHNPALREVNLENNTLTSLPGELFAHNPALTTVWLGHNRLTSLPADLFAAHHEALQKLGFSVNPELKHVPISFYRHWNAWNCFTRDTCGRGEVACAVADKPQLLDFAFDVPVPGAAD